MFFIYPVFVPLIIKSIFETETQNVILDVFLRYRGLLWSGENQVLLKLPVHSSFLIISHTVDFDKPNSLSVFRTDSFGRLKIPDASATRTTKMRRFDQFTVLTKECQTVDRTNS